jgi:hypothetical protein
MMSEGMKRAALAALETREWKTTDQQGRTCYLKGYNVRRLYDALPHEEAMLLAVGAFSRSDRRFDKAIQVLKKAGLVEYRDRQWWRTGEDR